MKKKSEKSAKVNKGMPSAVLLSIAIHVGLFLLATSLVVFTVVKKKEVPFEAPKAVERPKMRLKKPKVRVKKSSRPKSTARIATRPKIDAMPAIELPPGFDGMGDGLGDGIDVGFAGMPRMDEITVFGSGQSIGNDLVGTFYDFKRNRQGRGIPMSDYQFVDELVSFTSSGWKPSKLAKFYRSPNQLYATTIMMPLIPSAMAPMAFGEHDTVGAAWMVHYKGPLVYPEDITFRFWGVADDILVVRVDGEVVLNGSLGYRGNNRVGGLWQSSSGQSGQYVLGNAGVKVGDWITLKAGVPLELEIMVSEVPGGSFSSYLLVEVEGVEYERNRQNMPILPLFKTAKPTHELIDAISEHMVPDAADITGGPIFCDYAVAEPQESAAAGDIPEPTVSEAYDESSLRSWTAPNGKSFDAEYLSVVNNKVILRNARGKQIALRMEQLSPENLKFVGLANPPALDITFSKQSSQRIIKTSPYRASDIPPKILEYVFGTKIKQTSVLAYSHTLRVEYFAVAQRLVNGNEYRLIDRQRSSFIPSDENDRSHRFNGEPVELMEFIAEGSPRGFKYAEYLVIVTDERGEIIAHRGSAKWLFENLENLRQRSIGHYMNKSCERIHPTGPKTVRY